MAVEPRIARTLLAIAGSGDAVLFTGAGFSLGARDLAGAPLPGSEQMRRELWRIVFGDDHPDASTLGDLYDVALARAPDALAAYLDRRLRVGSVPTPRHHATWLAMPWRRIYTLNVDDLEAAVSRDVALPRPLHTVSARSPAALDRGTLSRARQLLLEDLGLTWVAATVEQVAELFAPAPRP